MLAMRGKVSVEYNLRIILIHYLATFLRPQGVHRRALLRVVRSLEGHTHFHLFIHMIFISNFIFISLFIFV